MELLIKVRSAGEVAMATAQTKDLNAYCDEVLSELAFMIQTVNELKAHAANTYGGDSKIARVHERHLSEIGEYLDWKLEILTKACPFEWKGMGESVESVVSVQQTETTGPEFSGGYVGG